MPVSAWFRLWLYPPASPVSARLTDAPSTNGLTPVVTDVEIPPERLAMLKTIQERQHAIINRLQAARLRREHAARRAGDGGGL